MTKGTKKTLSLLDGVSEMVFRISTVSGEILEYFAPEHIDLWLPRDKIIGFCVRDIKGVEGINEILNLWRNRKNDDVFKSSYEITAIGRTYEARLKESGKDEVFAIVKEITKQKKDQLELENKNRLLKEIENTLTAFTGKQYFDSLTLHLANLFKADYVFIGEVKNPERIETISFCENKKIKENFVYEVKHAPCEELLEKMIICFPERVSKIFNKDEFLVDNKIEGYLGKVLLDDDDQPIGVVIALFKKPIREQELFENLLHLLSGRAAAELKRELSERMLKKSESKFRDIFNSITDIYYHTNAAHELVLVSPSVESVAGYKPEQIVGKPVSYFYKDLSDQKRFLEKLIEFGSLKNYVFDLKKKNGDIIPIEINVKAEFDKHGNFAGSRGLLRDISEPIKQQKELQESEKKFRSLFEESSDAVVISDPKSRFILDVNQRMVDLLGFSREELLSKTIFDIRDESNYKKDKKAFHDFIKNGTDVYESVLISKSGERIDIEGSAKLIALGGRQVVQAFLRNITQRKKQEKISSLNKTILERVARDTDIYETLVATCDGIEEIYPDMICSVMLNDPVNDCLKYGAGSSLPKFYTKAIAQFPIGPNCGSCGTSAHYNKTVIVSDIENDPLWAPWKDLAARTKINACWSVPMTSLGHSLLGTFAVYYKNSKAPTKNEIELIKNFSNLIGLALENDQNKKNLTSKEKRYRQLVNNSPVGILIHTKGMIKFVNNEVLRMGKAQNVEQLIGKSVMEFVVPKFKPEVAKRIKKTEDLAQVIPRMEEQFKCLDGSIIDVEVMGTPISYEGEASTQLVFYDITERKKAEKQLKISEERHRSLNDSVLDAIIISDGKGNVLSWNKGAEKIFGFREEEVMDKPVTVIIPEQFVEECLKGLERIHQSGKSRSMGNIKETEGVNKKGELFPIEISTSSWTIGKERFFSAIIRDISERKAIENKQKSLNEHLIKQNKQLEEFAHIASHNLRAPIANIESLIQLQLVDDSEETAKFIFDQLQQVSKNLIGTIDDITEVLQTSWELNKKKQKLKFSKMFEKVMNTISRQTAEHEVNMESNFEVEDNIRYPRVYLESIMQNLILNAIKYSDSKKKSWVKVSTNYIEGELVLNVEDNGLGLNMKKHSKKLFGLRKTFHKNENARGVGLFITKAQVESMGGRIEVKSKEGKGSLFSVFFNNSNE